MMLLAQHEATSNDEHLSEFVAVLGLDAPATWASTQRGPGWSWEHTSGRRKRLDHLLFSAGDWSHASASQALDVDVMNSQRDHVALRVRTTLHCRCSHGPEVHTPGGLQCRESAEELGDQSVHHCMGFSRNPCSCAPRCKFLAESDQSCGVEREDFILLEP